MPDTPGHPIESSVPPFRRRSGILEFVEGRWSPRTDSTTPYEIWSSQLLLRRDARRRQSLGLEPLKTLSPPRLQPTARKRVIPERFRNLGEEHIESLTGQLGLLRKEFLKGTSSRISDWNRSQQRQKNLHGLSRKGQQERPLTRIQAMRPLGQSDVSRIARASLGQNVIDRLPGRRRLPAVMKRLEGRIEDRKSKLAATISSVPGLQLTHGVEPPSRRLSPEEQSRRDSLFEHRLLGLQLNIPPDYEDEHWMERLLQRDKYMPSEEQAQAREAAASSRRKQQDQETLYNFWKTFPHYGERKE